MTAEEGGPVAVLLMGYGSPSGPQEIRPYLSEVLHGRVPSDEMVEEYIRRYEMIGWSPQNRIVASVRDQLERRVARERPGSKVFLGMKHWKPRISDAIASAVREGFSELRAVPLSPYASIWIMEPYRTGVEEGIRSSPKPVTVDVRAGWHLDPFWIGYWSRAVRESVDRLDDPTAAVVLSAHALPERFLARGDPYPGLVQATAREVAAGAGLERWAFTYQSPGNNTEPWLTPDILDVMASWRTKGAARQLVASTGFVFDHLETLYDLDVVVKNGAKERGIEYHRVPMPNDAPEVVEAIARRALGPSAPSPP